VISPQCLVIFGASGDSSPPQRLWIALFELFAKGGLPSEFASSVVRRLV